MCPSKINQWFNNHDLISFKNVKIIKFYTKENLKISHFEVLEVDLDFKEITIRDLYLGLNFIVDLEEKDISLIHELDLKHEDSIVAIIYAKLDNFGNTTQWFFHSILQKMHNKP